MAALAAVVLLAGCAATLVPETSDPSQKLAWANELVVHQQRPLPAERLIQEAIEIFQQRGDPIGLARAYHTYGIFFSAPSLQRWSQFYREHGFLDRTAVLESRYARAIDYFEKARVILERHAHFALLADTYLHMGMAQERIGDWPAACGAYRKSLAALEEHQTRTPAANSVPPISTSEYTSFLASSKDRVCVPGRAPYSAAAKANPSGTATITLKADWLSTNLAHYVFGDSQQHQIDLAYRSAPDGPDRTGLVHVGRLENRTLFNDAAVTSVDARLPASTRLQMRLEYQSVGKAQRCVIPFSITLEPDRHYVIDFAVSFYWIRLVQRCDPKFYVVEDSGETREISVLNTW